MNKLIFDTETSGLPITKSFNNYFHPEELKYYESSRIVQIAYKILDNDNIEIKSYTTIIKPDNFIIKNEIIHHISQEKAEKEGIPFIDMINIFYEDIKICDTIIAHNLNFDKNVLLSECYRCGLKEVVDEIQKKKEYCTMLEGHKMIGGGNKKFPRLIDLYSCFYKEPWNQIHDAMDDCIKCERCYVKLINLK